MQFYGFEPRAGNLEIYPNARGNKNAGSALRLPLQAGWAFLDQEDLQLVKTDLSPNAVDSMRSFMNDFGASANTLRDLENALRRRSSSLTKRLCQANRKHLRGSGKAYNEGVFINCPKTPSSIKISAQSNLEISELSQSELENDLHREKYSDMWLEGKALYDEGLSETVTRSRAIFLVNYYLICGDIFCHRLAKGRGFESLRVKLISEWLQHKHNGWSKEVNARTSDAFEQIVRIVNWESPGNEKQTSNFGRDGYRAASERQAITKQLEIISWVEKLSDQGIPSQRQLHKITGIAMKTLQKYRHLWEHLLQVYLKNKNSK